MSHQGVLCDLLSLGSHVSFREAEVKLLEGCRRLGLKLLLCPLGHIINKMVHLIDSEYCSS